MKTPGPYLEAQALDLGHELLDCGHVLALLFTHKRQLAAERRQVRQVRLVDLVLHDAAARVSNRPAGPPSAAALNCDKERGQNTVPNKSWWDDNLLQKVAEEHFHRLEAAA